MIRVLGIALAALSLAAPAAGAEVALDCQPEVERAAREPVLFLHGTGNGGRDEWADVVDFQSVVAAAGHPSCLLELPGHALVDVQTSAEDVVVAIRRTHRLAGRRIAVYGHSQGGLLAQWALTYWPALRSKVADVVSVAGPHHGTTWGSTKPLVDQFCGPLFAPGCPAAFRQQTAGSALLAALARRPDETPGTRTGWTTVRSATDELVQPPASTVLDGAVNLEVQSVCPGRQVGHSAVQYDSVAYAALIDALRHRGPASSGRLPADVCAHRFAPGLDDSTVTAREYSSRAIAVQRALTHSPQTGEEPPVRAYAAG